tara:strand:- start:358 stop:840 length:483 start_codon:yes stop_codon:yes gene_type:complete
MSKIISSIDILTDGGINPETGIHEEKLWQLHFVDDVETRIMGRSKVLEYLTKGTVPPKTVHSFKKWDITTTTGYKVRTWVIVYDDKSHVQMINKDFYSLVTNGHKVEQEKEEQEHSSPPPIDRSTPLNPVLFESNSTTTNEERKQIDSFREKIKEEIDLN